jgi:hypothetical protein
VFAEELLDAEPLEEAIEKRQSAYPERLERMSLGVRHFPWPTWVPVIIHVSYFRGTCRERV